MKVGFVVPVLNEVDVIGGVLNDFNRFFSSGVFSDFEVVLVDGGSDDGTRDVIYNFVESENNFHCLASDSRLYKGESVSKGVNFLDADVYVVMDGDGSVCFRDLLKGLNRFVSSDFGSEVLVGCRSVEGRPSFVRWFASSCYNFYVNFLFSTGVGDHQCGLKIFSDDVLERVVEECLDGRWFWDTEFLVRCCSKGVSVSEFNVSWSDGSESNVNLARDGLRLGFKVLRLKRNGF